MDITLEQKSTAVHGAFGVILGVASGILSKDPYQLANTQILLLTVGVLFILYFITQKLFKLREISTEKQKYDKKWYLSNGVYPYLIFWLVVWIFVYNL